MFRHEPGFSNDTHTDYKKIFIKFCFCFVKVLQNFTCETKFNNGFLKWKLIFADILSGIITIRRYITVTKIYEVCL
jgi:hypothetical protein